MIGEFYYHEKFYELYDENKEMTGCCKVNGVVIHHKDEDKTNNSPDNLEVTTPGEHMTHHGSELVCKKNPMYGRKQKDSTKKLIGQKCKERCQDPQYRKKLSEYQTEEMRKESSKRMKYSKLQWDQEKTDTQEEQAKKSGLTYTRVESKLLIHRVCENDGCGKKFTVSWNKRSQPYCSISCANTKKESIENRRIGQLKTFEKNAENNFFKQAQVYLDLVEKNNGNPVMKKEWEQSCKKQKISYRFNAKSDNPWIANGWKDFKQMVTDRNHQVDYIEELDGKNTVYCLTVDSTHTVCVVTKANDDMTSLTGLVTGQCSEISLCNYELCNLSELFPTRCRGLKEFQQAIEYATFYASTVSLLPTHRPETNAVIAKNRRIGVSISGIAQWASLEKDSRWGKMNYTRMTKFLRDGYKLVRKYNTELAELAGVPPSIRVTAVKPSGTISLLAGVTSGVHYPVSRYAIRRVRVAENSPLVPTLKEAKIPHEKDISSDNTLVFDFVVDHGNVRPCEEVSPWEQFSLVAMMQRCWSDNMVSATIYFDKKKDAPDVEKMLAMFIPVLKSVSMLPHAGHGYAQAPYEPITKEKYEELLAGYQKIDFNNVQDNVPLGSKFCTGDKCTI
jgi:hypothetical protein